MGNSRYGALAKTRNWLKVVELLADEQATVGEVATETITAARHAILTLQRDRLLAHCGFLLTHLAWEARNQRLTEFLNEVGIPSAEIQNRSDLISALARYFTERRQEFGNITALSEVTESAFLETIQRTLSGSTQSLFEAGIDEIESAFKACSTPRGFSEATVQFFSSFLRRTLRYFLSKEIPNHIGLARRFESLDAVAEFDKGVDRFSSENAKILSQYSQTGIHGIPSRRGLRKRMRGRICVWLWRSLRTRSFARVHGNERHSFPLRNRSSSRWKEWAPPRRRNRKPLPLWRGAEHQQRAYPPGRKDRRGP